MGSFFIYIYQFFEKRKGLLWFCAIACFLIAGYFASRIRLEEDITRILPRDEKLNKLQQVFQDSKFADKLVLTISLKDSTANPQPDSLTTFAAEFSSIAAAQLSPYIKQLQGQTADATVMDLMQVIRTHLPVFLEEKDYDSIDALITTGRLNQTLQQDYQTLISPAGLVMKQMIQADPVGISWLGIRKLQRLQYDEQFELYDGYVMTKDQCHLLLFITPVHPPGATGKNAPFLHQLDITLDSLQQQHPLLKTSYFGATAVSAGNAVQLRQDTLFTQGITVVLLIVLIAFFFRKKRAPLLVMIPVAFGGLFSLGGVALLKGSISVIALGGGSVVLGIAVNYSLHVFNHYRHLPDIREVIKDLATPMTVGSFTTVGGFLCLQLVKSPILQDVGLFAALSLVGAALYSLIFLPHWIVLGKQPSKDSVPRHTWLDKIAAYRPERSKVLVAGIMLLTIVFFFTARYVSFESDMMRMNFMSPALQEAEAELNRINAYAAQSIYVVTEGKDLDEALRHQEKMMPLIQQLKQQGMIRKAANVDGLMPSLQEQQQRIQRWNQFWSPEKKQQLLAYLQQQGPAIGFRPAAFTPFAEWLHSDFGNLSAGDLALLKKGPLSDFITEKPDRTSLVTLLKVETANKPAVYKALEGLENATALDKQYTANRLAQIIRDEFNSIAWMTSILVFVALLLSYGRIELALITFIPMLVSWVWILGIMGLFGIRFNIVNIILSTFIFGLGDDYSIFTMDGLIQQYKSGKQYLSSFRSSIFFSAITTILGLGVLIFAQHPSLRSIALISIIGIGCVVLISQVLIPFLFNWLITDRVSKGLAPWTLTGWAKSVFAFIYFTVGSLLLTVVGFVLIRINPFNKQKGKYLYHVALSAYTHSLLYIMANVKKRIINPLNEQLETPAVIISNHQSFLDILVSTMLHPKVILLTNEWVWRSPVFGAVVRMAEYYPVADGVEGSIDKLKEKVAQGYSIVVYPEGTRSPDPVIKRFHKGAFFIAEQLNLDILPMVIHGTAYTMSKGDFLLKDGLITVKYLPRIKQNDPRWGEGYAARTKQISRYFKTAYEQIRAATEVPAYYRELLIYNYLYKGPVLEWYMRVKTSMEKNYALFHELLPQDGRIIDIGCGYGFLAYMLHFLSPGRRITGVDYDEDKIATAAHAYLRKEQLDFICTDITTYDLPEADAYVISDVLHYLRPEQQESILLRCISRLNEGGMILLRDGDADMQKRHERTRLTEFFSTRLLGFNKTSQSLSFFSAAHIEQLVTNAGAVCERIDNTRFTSNIIFVIRKNPPPTT